MPYESTITFTLDTICPWTYLALLRLQRALSTFSSPNATFTLVFAPYQLYPEFSATGEDRYAWYLASKYDNNAATMSKYAAYMTTLFDVEDVRWTPHGTIANTLPAHRVLHEVQATHDPATTLSLLMNLYEAYFTRGMHPSAGETLRGACVAAGLGDDQVESVVGDESVGLVGVKEKIGEQVSDGVDSVPHVVVEGRRRDFTLVGAKEVEEYVKVLEQVAKEA